MATIFRALMTAVLLLYAYVAYTGWQMSQALATGPAGGAIGPDSAAAQLKWHLGTGLVATVVAALAQSVPFAYFLGTGFWVKAFVRASRADGTWEARQKLWLKSSAFVIMALAPLFTLAAAITGGLTDSGRIPPLWHAVAVGLALLAALFALLSVPAEMRRNSALMDELAERHQVPRPGTQAAEELIAFEESRALPPLFQLSRLMLFFGVQLVVVWLYLRYGTEGWRDVALLPFGVGCLVLVTAGLGLNAMHDPDAPQPAARAWARALAVGIAGAVVLGLVIGLTR